MNIVKTIDQYDDNCVYFCEPTKNNIMLNGTFIRILYSNSLAVLNGIYIGLDIYYTSIEKYYNKFKCSFDISQYNDLIERIRLLEQNILTKYKCSKNPNYRIYEQIKCGNIKVFSEFIDKTNSLFYLKIAGIWETETDYGLTYKFMVCNK